MKTSRFEIVAESDRYREARQRLVDRTAAVETRLAARLHDVQGQRDLTWRLLLSSQRKISKAIGHAPSPTQFWETEAAPMAAAFATAARLVIDSELENVSDAVSRFTASVSPLLSDPSIGQFVRTDVSVVLQVLGSNTLDDGPLNDLGDRWQERLHRQAIRRCMRLRNSNTGEPFDAVVAREELDMLDKAPWIHGDRLLSAFEIAHSETRSHLRDMLAAASVIVTSRPASQVNAPI